MLVNTVAFMIQHASLCAIFAKSGFAMAVDIAQEPISLTILSGQSTRYNITYLIIFILKMVLIFYNVFLLFKGSISTQGWTFRRNSSRMLLLWRQKCIRSWIYTCKERFCRCVTLQTTLCNTSNIERS